MILFAALGDSSLIAPAIDTIHAIQVCASATNISVHVTGSKRFQKNVQKQKKKNELEFGPNMWVANNRRQSRATNNRYV